MFTDILKTDSIPESCYRRLQHITTRNAMFLTLYFIPAAFYVSHKNK